MGLQPQGLEWGKFFPSCALRMSRPLPIIPVPCGLGLCGTRVGGGDRSHSTWQAPGVIVCGAIRVLGAAR